MVNITTLIVILLVLLLQRTGAFDFSFTRHIFLS